MQEMKMPVRSDAAPITEGDADTIEIIEDKRTTSDNRIEVDRYTKGRMLGKVNATHARLI